MELGASLQAEVRLGDGPERRDIYVLQPAKVFAFKEGADDFAQTATRWTFG